MKSTTYHGEVDIEYAFRPAPNPTDVLVIAFPGAANAGFDIPNISFNYMMTIGQFNANAIYIQTNKDYSKSYLRCKNRDLVIERSIIALINQYIKTTNSTHVIAIGSSMGGFCALYYGLKYDWEVISGSLSPYMLYDDSSLRRRLTYSCGSCTSEDKKWFDGLIIDVIKEAGERGYNKKVFFSWGEGEQAWIMKNQAPQLLKDLDEAGIKYSYKLYPFSNHFAVSASFPNVLKAYLGYYLGMTDEPKDEAAESVEQKTMKIIKEGYSSLLPEIDKLTLGYPFYKIKRCALHCETNIQTCLRNYCYIEQGFCWFLDSKEPYNIQDKDLFWGNLPIEHIREAVCFYFQSSLLYLYEKKEFRGALDWCIENARQYVKYVSSVAEPKQNNDWWNANCRIPFFINLQYYMDKNGISVDWSELIAKEIKKDLKLVCASEELISDAEIPFKRILGVLIGITYFKNNTSFFDKAYNTLINILSELTDYCFDKNGFCIIRQVRHHSILTKRIMLIIKFIDANELPETKQLKAYRRKYELILECAAHISRPDNHLPALGYSTYDTAWWTQNLVARKASNLILKSSNIAFLEDDKSLSYITVNGGSNIHSVHRHCDLLSFTWYYDGKQIFADSEGGLKDVADHARSAVAHNAFICDEIDYVTPEYNDWTSIFNFKEQGDYVFISMRHVLISGVMMKRHLLWIKPNILIIVDEGDSDTQHLYTQNYVLENYEADLSDPQEVTIAVTDKIKAKILQFHADDIDFDVKSYNGTDDINDTENYRGSLVTGWKKLRKGLNIAYNKMAMSAKYITVIECNSENDNAKVSEVNVKSVSLSDFIITAELTNGTVIKEEIINL